VISLSVRVVADGETIKKLPDFSIPGDTPTFPRREDKAKVSAFSPRD
jgi:hypothetical protein